MCYRTYHYSIEEAVQAGLQEWSEGHCSRPPTWKVLLDAMDHGGIACQHIASLKAELLGKRGILTVYSTIFSILPII